jgi:mono/diheme cytochrome c family protein
MALSALPVLQLSTQPVLVRARSHQARDGTGAISVSAAWWATMAAAVLHADRRAGGGNFHHPASGSSTVCNLCHGSKDTEMGDKGSTTAAGNRPGDRHSRAHSGHRVMESSIPPFGRDANHVQKEKPETFSTTACRKERAVATARATAQVRGPRTGRLHPQGPARPFSSRLVESGSN